MNTQWRENIFMRCLQICFSFLTAFENIHMNTHWNGNITSSNSLFLESFVIFIPFQPRNSSSNEDFIASYHFCAKLQYWPMFSFPCHMRWNGVKEERSAKSWPQLSAINFFPKKMGKYFPSSFQRNDLFLYSQVKSSFSFSFSSLELSKYFSILIINSEE